MKRLLLRGARDNDRERRQCQVSGNRPRAGTIDAPKAANADETGHDQQPRRVGSEARIAEDTGGNAGSDREGKRE